MAPIIGKPAPDFCVSGDDRASKRGAFRCAPPPTLQTTRPPILSAQGTAVIGTEMKEIKLSDYKGKYLVLYF
jgi:hypothetical protein